MNEQYLFFWGEAPYSQWVNSWFTIDGINYNCTEQFMMAEKARLFGDTETLQAILEADLPSDQKRLGRQVKDFNADKWNAVAKDIVYRGNRAKFSQNPKMRAELFSTHPKILVEASPYDKIWGIGMKDFEARTTPPEKWRGTNWLGEVLTKVRDDMMQAEDSLHD